MVPHSIYTRIRNTMSRPVTVCTPRCSVEVSAKVNHPISNRLKSTQLKAKLSNMINFSVKKFKLLSTRWMTM